MVEELVKTGKVEKKTSKKLDQLIQAGILEKYEYEEITEGYYGFTSERLILYFKYGEKLCIETSGNNGDDLETNSDLYIGTEPETFDY